EHGHGAVRRLRKNTRNSHRRHSLRKWRLRDTLGDPLRSIERETEGGNSMGTPFMSEIKIISWNFAPKGWALCNGQFLPINQNQALLSLLGTMYGGNGQTTFALPDMRGRMPLHIGNGFTQGQAGGQEFHTVTIS